MADGSKPRRPHAPPAAAATGSWAEAAVLHDFLYAVGEKAGRPDADRLMLTAMLEQGTPAWIAHIIHSCVVLFGAKSYGRKGEWDLRFGNPETGGSAPAPPAKPASAVVARGVSAEQFEKPEVRRAILASIGAPSPGRVSSPPIDRKVP